MLATGWGRWIVVGVVLVGGLVVVGCCVRMVRDPLRRSPREIERSLHRHTPIGMPDIEARALIRGSWPQEPPYADAGVTYEGDARGFVKQEPPRPPVVVGATSAKAYLGWYWSFESILPFRTDVTAFWAFDDKGKLVEVWVWKTTDVL